MIYMIGYCAACLRFTENESNASRCIYDAMPSRGLSIRLQL